MSSVLDRYLGIEPAALVLAGERTNVLAANLANVDTPGYKARDLDFKAALAAAARTGGLPAAADGTTLALAQPHDADDANAAATATNAAPAADATDASTGGIDAAAYLKYRVPLAPSLDGNTVDGQLAEAAFAENSVRYQATLTLLNSKLRDLLTAIGSQ